MLQKYITTLVILIMGLSAHAQSTYFNVTETEPFKDSRRGSSLEGAFTLASGEIVAVRAAKKELLVSSFDANYNLQSDVELDLERRESYLGASFNNEKLRVFTVHKVDKNKRDVFCHTYTIGSRTIVKTKLYTATSSTQKRSKYGASGPKKHNENFRGSPDGNYLAFAVDNINSKTNSYSFRVYDQDLNLVYDTSYYSDIERYFNFDDFIITNDAEIISAGKLYKKGKRDRREGKANYDYVIHKVTENESASSVLELQDNFIKELRFAQTDELIRLFGFYSERSSDRMKGALSYNMQGTNIEAVSLKQAPFPESIYQDLFRDARAERLKEKEKEFRDFYLDYAFVDESGNSYLLAEEFYITTTSVPNGAMGGMSTNSQPHYDDILIIKFDSAGNILWGRGILKKDNQPSYNALVMDNELHVFFNTGKNIKEKEDGRKKAKRHFFSSTALFDVVFDADGKDTFEMIQENKGKAVYRPYLGTYDYDKFILANLSKSKKQFLILTKK